MNLIKYVLAPIMMLTLMIKPAFSAQKLFRSDYQTVLSNQSVKLQQVDILSADVRRLLQISEGNSANLESLLPLEESQTQAVGRNLVSVLQSLENFRKLSAQDILLKVSYLSDKVQIFQKKPTVNTLKILIDEISYVSRVLPSEVEDGEDKSIAEVVNLMNTYQKYLSSSQNPQPFQVPNPREALEQALNNLMVADFFSPNEATLILLLESSLNRLSRESSDVQQAYLRRLADRTKAVSSQLRMTSITPLANYLYAAWKSQLNLTQAYQVIKQKEKLDSGMFNLSFMDESINGFVTVYKLIVSNFNSAPPYGKVGFITLPELRTDLDTSVYDYTVMDIKQTTAAILFYQSRGFKISNVERPLQLKGSAVISYNLFGTIAAFPAEFAKLRSLCATSSLYELAVGNRLGEILDRAMFQGAIKTSIQTVLKNDSDPLIASVRIELARALKAPDESSLDSFMEKFRLFKTDNPEPEFGFR